MGVTLLRASDREIRDFERSSSLTRLRTTGSQATMHLSSNVRTLCSRVHTILRQRRRKPKRSLQISAPFNLQREPVSLPGISEDEITMLRERAAASRIGIADPASPRTPCSASSLFSHPVRPSIVSVLPPHATISTESFHSCRN
ncbi:hypothetical protein G7046_g1647 [Stylonectria norvegica]|nr:hypothetical protein G7046_g1647 [Stylonectria norvegica]